MLVSRLYLLAPPSGRSANTVVALDARQSLQSSYPNTPRFFLQSYAQMGLIWHPIVYFHHMPPESHFRCVL